MQPDVCTRRLGDYMLGPILGRGKFAKVRVATKAGDPATQYAVKYMKVGAPYTKAFLMETLKEEALLGDFHHRNVLQLYETNYDGIYEKTPQTQSNDGTQEMTKEIPVVYAVLQRARTGDLFDFVVGFGGLSETMARVYFAQLLDALDYLHGSGYAHRDFKPENILLDVNYSALLSDFGYCKKLAETGPLTSRPEDRVGTERYMSPELLSAGAHGPVKDDLFALGVTLFMMVACHPPFVAASIHNEHYNLLRTHQVRDYWKIMNSLRRPNCYSEEFMHLVTLMLSYEPSMRPTISEIRAHPWVQKPLPTPEELKKEFEVRQTKAIEYQIKEAAVRKQKRLAQREEERKASQPSHMPGPHHIKRAGECELRTNPLRRLKKKVKEFGFIDTHRPTIMFSQESCEEIEDALNSFFQSAKNLDLNKEKCKVLSERANPE